MGKKTAVDPTATSYWTDYFKDSGYGATWVQKIPMRVKAALERKAGLSKSAIVKLFGHAITKRSVVLEGMARGFTHDSQGRIVKGSRLFSATFDHSGRLTRFDSVVAP